MKMDFKLEIMEIDHMIDFLLNPFDKTANCHDYIMQKYPKTPFVDVLFEINKDSDCCITVGYVNYQLRKVFVFNEEPFNELDLKNDPFVIVDEVKQDLKKTIMEMIETAKADRMAEIQRNHYYLKHYHRYKSKIFKHLISQLLGTQPYEVLFKSSTDSDVSIFCAMLSIEKLMRVFSGDKSDLDAFVEKTIFSEIFIISDIVLEKLKEEAYQYVKNGYLTKEELMLFDFLKKTKASGAKRFTVHMTSGRKLRCINKVTSEGKLYEAGDSYYRVNFIDIKKVEYRGKVIYERMS